MDIGLFTEGFMHSSSIPLYALDPTFWSVPAAVVAFRIAEPAKEKGCILTIDGVPQHVLLARLNQKRGLVKDKRLKKPIEAIGNKVRKEGDRGEVKATNRQHAHEDHLTQIAYEKAFKVQARWPWRMVQKEARKRSLKLTAAGLAALATAVGILVDLPVFA